MEALLMTTTTQKHPIPWYLWPFAALWKLLAVIVEMTGRFVAMVLGVVFFMVGIPPRDSRHRPGSCDQQHA